jgi:hypothetical protein
MTAISLHATPRWHAIAWEQVRTVGLRLRTTGALLFVMLALYGGVAIRVALSARETNLAHAGRATLDFSYSTEVSAIFACMALLLPLAMWNEEDPARRAYHWSMPMARANHALTRTFAGWVWLILVTACWLAFVMAIDAITRRIVGKTPSSHSIVRAWELLVPFTAATIAYLFASAAAIGARTPLVWIAGPPLIYAGVSILAFTLGYPEVSRAMTTITSGFYGASAAMAGVVRVDGVPSLDRWLGAAALWGGAAAALIYAVSHRRSNTT